jgi:hypothetical protein
LNWNQAGMNVHSMPIKSTAFMLESSTYFQKTNKQISMKRLIEKEAWIEITEQAKY